MRETSLIQVGEGINRNLELWCGKQAYYKLARVEIETWSYSAGNKPNISWRG